MMRSLLLITVLLSMQAKAQNTFIKTQGFGGNKIGGAGLVTEYDNHYYFSFALSDIGTIPTEYVVAKYDTLGNFLSKKTIGNGLHDPTLRKTQMDGDTMFYKQFQKYSSARSISIIQKNSIEGNFKWNTSTSIYVEDFIGHSDSLFAVGKDTNSNGWMQQAIYSINPETGTVSQKNYFTEISEFKVDSADSAFKVIEITALDSSIFVLFHRKSDSAKFVYEFDLKLNYKNHFEIAKDAFRFLNNDKFLIVSHQWMAPGLMNKGRAEVYSLSGGQLWTFEKQKENLDYLFSIRQAIVLKNKLILVAHNFDKDIRQAWQDVYFLDYSGNELRKFKLESGTYNPSIRTIAPINNGFLINDDYTDYDDLILKTDTCFNAKSDKYPQWLLEFPDCGALNSNINNLSPSNERITNVYPNPTSSNFSFVSNSNQTLNYTFMNLNGQILLEGNFENKTHLDVSNLSDGIYFLQLKGEGILETRKVVVQH
ncbi:MAG: T9SS type A sorting domain-containing protein [Flavobacteriales bacterium]|nr:T9SS type A sorting domain-containing protein [Flavobacteriales bacterium]